MKTILYAGVATIALCATASAADLTYEPAPAPVVVAPAFNWTGFYVGVHGGGGWGSYNLDSWPGLLGDANGAIAGAQAGYNYQVNQWVFGIQTDLAYSWINTGSTIFPGYGLGTINTELDWLGTTTVRAGYAWDTWLFYAKGGFAYGDSKVSLSNYYTTDSKWRTGWTVGGGVEKAFTPHITGFAEYDYVDLGNSDYYVGNIDFNTSIVKVGLNYKF